MAVATVAVAPDISVEVDISAVAVVLVAAVFAGGVSAAAVTAGGAVDIGVVSAWGLDIPHISMTILIGMAMRRPIIMGTTTIRKGIICPHHPRTLRRMALRRRGQQQRSTTAIVPRAITHISDPATTLGGPFSQIHHTQINSCRRKVDCPRQREGERLKSCCGAFPIVRQNTPSAAARHVVQMAMPFDLQMNCGELVRFKTKGHLIPSRP